MRKEHTVMQAAAGQKSRKGSVGFEFAIVTALFYVPLLMGTVVLGMNLVRSTQVVQITRDAGHMWGQGVDFSQPGNRQFILRLAQGLNIADTGGNGLIRFSQIMFVAKAQCTDAGLSDAQCKNKDHYVVTRRIVIGNGSLKASAYGEPNAGLINAAGDVSNYLTDTSARADAFANLLQLLAGDSAYFTESYFISPDYDWSGFMKGTGIYSSAVF